MTQQEQVLILEPGSEIHFVGPFKDVVTSFLSLTNPIDQPVCFKVRTTAPKRCCIRPNNGILEPKQKVTLFISLQPNFNPNEEIKLKFMIQSMIVSESIVNIDILFQEAKPENIMDSKLTCVFDMFDKNKMVHNILIIGSGGREHALAWKLSHSPTVKQIFIAPGNAGTHLDTCGKITNVAMNVKNNEEIAEWCNVLKIDIVVGDKGSLCNGIADYLNKQEVKCFGPCQKAAQIESKEFFNSFTDCYNIPVAEWKSFTDAKDAEKHILSVSYNAFMVKANGLSAGKRVIVASSKEDAVKAVYSLKEDTDLSSVSDTIVVEELLEGEKTSVLCFSDGTNISIMPPAQHRKCLINSNEGLIPGGMGAYCRCLMSDDTLKLIQRDILQKAIDGMKYGGDPCVGVLYASLMITRDGPKVLEFKCRFGDPETQVILPLLNSDLCEVMLACVNGTLEKMAIQWSPTKFAVGVEVVSGGYPDNYSTGKVINGLCLDELPSDCTVFHAGTAMNGNRIVTTSGRVLTVVALEETPWNALSMARKCASKINFDDSLCCNVICSQRF